MSARGSTLTMAAGLLLVAIFAAAMLLTLASGARVYQELDAAAREQYGERTALGYIAAKLRGSDTAGAVTLGRLGDCEALILTREQDGADYDTYIYCCDGSLRELLCPAGELHDPREGERVLELGSVSFTLEDGLLTARCTLEGRDAQTSVCVNAGEAAA